MAIFKLDNGRGYSEAYPEDLAQYPFLAKPFGNLPDELPSDLRIQPLKAPTQYQDRPVEAWAWRSTPAGGLFTFLRWGQSEYGLGDPGPGMFAVVDRSSGAIRWVLPFTFDQGGAGRSISWKPDVAKWGPTALVSDGNQITAFDVDRGEKLWSKPGQPGWWDGLDGVWQVGEALYVNLRGGVARLDAATGREFWCSPYVGPYVRNVTARPDGTICVVAYDPPTHFREALRAAARDRFHSDKPALTNLVPYKTSFFGLTYFSDSRSFPDNTKRTISAWEYKDGRWQWIFDYASKLSEAERDALFAKNGFSSKMRRRLEKFNLN